MFEAFWSTVDAVLSSGAIVIGFTVIAIIVAGLVVGAYKLLR